MPKRALLQSPSHPSVELHDFRTVGKTKYASGRVTDGSMVNQRRPWCLMSIKDDRLEVLANFATLKEAQIAYRKHCLIHAGIDPS
jgi:hypothetical protein